MPLFATTWPWIGLGAAAMLILLLSIGDGLQADRRISRWQDLPWLTWAGVAAYMVHQFEEHGVDLFGKPYAFRGALCAMLGFRDAVSCPVPLDFITAVNVGGVWGAGLLCALLAKRWPLIGLSFFAVPMVNIFAHVGPAVAQQRYNPGLFTALVLFLPLCLWTLFIAARRYGAGVRTLALVVASGVAVHVILMGSLLAYLRDFIGLIPLVAIQILNGFLPAAVLYLAVYRQRQPARPAAAAPRTPRPPRPRRPPKGESDGRE